MSTRALLDLGLGGSFFGQFVKAAGPKRLDFRMNVTMTQQQPRIATVESVAPQPSIVPRGQPALTLVRGTSPANTVADRANAVRGVIPEGSQGVRLRASEQEWLTGAVPAGVLDGDCFSIAWYGVIHALPSEDDVLVPLVYLRARLAGADHRFGIAVTHEGELWSIYNDSFGDIVGTLPAVGQPVFARDHEG